MPAATIVTIGSSNPDTNGTLDLNGHLQTIGGLTDLGAASRRVINSGASAATLTINNTGNYTFAGVIEGSINLVKQGTGTQTLSGANTYTGTTTVSAGALRIAHGSALGSTDQGTTVADGARLEVSGGITVAEPITITGHGGNWGGALQSISADNTWTGLITSPSGGRIGVTTASTFTITGGITGTSIYLCGWANGTIRIINQPITLTSSLGVVDNTTALIEVAGNMWAGTYVSHGGVLKLGVSDALPATTVVTLGSTANNNGTLDLNGHQQTIGGLTDLGTASRRVINSGASAATLTINNTGNYTFAGVMEGSINLVKQGTGTQTLSGANTYTGITDVQAGTLALVSTTGNNNVPNSSVLQVRSGATLNVTGLDGPGGADTLILASGQTLRGNGTVVGNVQTPAGAFLGAGLSPGHLTITGNYTQAGTLLVELAGYQQGGTQAVPGQWATNGYDWVSVNGSAVLDGYLQIDLLAGFQPASGDTFNVLTALGGITDQGLILQGSGLLPAQYWTYQIIQGQGGEQILQLQLAVPEPGTMGLMILGILCTGASFVLRRRRKR